MRIFSVVIFFVLLVGCNEREGEPTSSDDREDTVAEIRIDTPVAITVPPPLPGLQPDSLLAFARTLLGVPYLYASTDPAKGLDCSGFITCVFNHFGVTVPRSSVDFTHYGQEIDTSQAKPGDLILFTGTDSTIRIVGHMGIIESIKDGKIHFIHSTSGKNGLGVVITPFEKYYRSRFVKVIRIFSPALLAVISR